MKTESEMTRYVLQVVIVFLRLCLFSFFFVSRRFSVPLVVFVYVSTGSITITVHPLHFTYTNYSVLKVHTCLPLKVTFFSFDILGFLLRCKKKIWVPLYLLLTETVWIVIWTVPIPFLVT